ncbi:MAG: type II toxin-antitoxin system VapC family toxin [Actinobacteria bacterium]|nr:type II toxin-antitoxin system VapC family toxin [Actinomycetota bacterium]MBM3712571.1 type II toxin-antitoxin system VapC family toxin [Actinomycetota bacterium]
MIPPFLDANIILHHLLGDHQEHSPRATAYLKRVEQGEIQVRTADTIIFEVVFTLQRQYHQPKLMIREVLLPLIELPGIILPGKRRFRKVFDLYVDLNLSFADAYHGVLMQQNKINQIVTFDKGFDRLPEIERVEP